MPCAASLTEDLKSGQLVYNVLNMLSSFDWSTVMGLLSAEIKFNLGSSWDTNDGSICQTPLAPSSEEDDDCHLEQEDDEDCNE